MKTWDNLKRSFKIAILTVLCIILAFSTGLLYVLSYGATSEPEINAKSAVLYSENTKTVVFSKNKDERVAPFSTTKLMTALMVVKHIKNLDQKVTVSKEAAALDGSSMELKEGDVILVKEKSQSSPKFKQLRDMIITTPKWVTIDTDKLEGKILALPQRDDIDVPIAEHNIVELYSK